MRARRRPSPRVSPARAFSITTSPTLAGRCLSISRFRNMKTISFFMMTAGFVLLDAAVAQGQSAGVMREARVTQIVKDVKLLSSQAEARPATLTDKIHGDTSVRTGLESRAELTFADLTIARLGANTI